MPSLSHQQRLSELSEETPLRGNVQHKVAQLEQSGSALQTTTEVKKIQMHKRIILWVILITRICFILVILFSLLDLLIYLLKDISSSSSSSVAKKKKSDANKIPQTSPYTKVQTLSFQIYTGGAPAFIIDDETGKEKKNHECHGLHSYGQPEDSDTLQCYLGLQNTTADVRQRLSIMQTAVERAYEVSEYTDDDTTLKIFIAPEFYFRGLNGAFSFQTEESEEVKEGVCNDICQILRGLESIVADERFEHWLFLFGTVIASETLATEETDFDYQFYNFAPLYKGYNPDTTASNKQQQQKQRIGKNFIVPKRYISNIDFLTPTRDLTNKSMVMELLDETDGHLDGGTLMNPHLEGIKRYHNDIWVEYKDELTLLGYTMIEYGWFYIDGIAFSVEICLDHLAHRAVSTYMADVVTGSKTLIPNSANDTVEWVGIPRQQAQISLVSSAGMEVTVESIALANGGYIFLQDGVNGNVMPHQSYGEDDCKPNEYEFFGGSQSIQRTAVVTATDVTFDYDMNMDYENYDLYTTEEEDWKDKLKGVFSTVVYKPHLTVYDAVNIPF